VAAVDLLPRLKRALDMTSTSADPELLELLDAAQAEYVQHVGPLPGSQVVTLSGASSPYVLPRGTTAVTATYANGTAISGTSFDLDAQSGLLYADGIAYGRRNVRFTVTVGALPENHAATIVEDCAEYWQRTQRAVGGARPSFGGDGFEADPGRPLVQFPRIRALAGPLIA